MTALQGLPSKLYDDFAQQQTGPPVAGPIETPATSLLSVPTTVHTNPHGNNAYSVGFEADISTSGFEDLHSIQAGPVATNPRHVPFEHLEHSAPESFYNQTHPSQPSGPQLGPIHDGTRVSEPLTPRITPPDFDTSTWDALLADPASAPPPTQKGNGGGNAQATTDTFNLDDYIMYSSNTYTSTGFPHF
jgi:hypothetical protein